MEPREVARYKCFGGTLCEYEHDSEVTHTPMKFALYRPRSQEPRPRPLFYLAGLTRDHLRFSESSVNGLKTADELGLALAFADTSPRNLPFPEFREREEIGNAASFYIDADQPPWSQNFHMYSYLIDEWIPLVLNMLGSDPNRKGIFGHSMGGHGAMILALRNPSLFQSVSAIAPAGHPSASSLVSIAYSAYLGPDPVAWKRWDSTELIASGEGENVNIRVDIAGSDELEPVLKNDDLEDVCRAKNRANVQFHHHEGFSHGCYFVSSILESVLNYHNELLR